MLPATVTGLMLLDSLLDQTAQAIGERRLHRFLEAHRLGRDDVHQRSALHAGEHRAIEVLRVFLLAHHHAAGVLAEVARQILHRFAQLKIFAQARMPQVQHTLGVTREAV